MMETTSQLINGIRAALERAGLGDAELVSAASGAPSSGDARVIFGLGPLLLRVTEDRGQRFLDIAFRTEPATFHQFDDIDIAMGWRSLESVLSKHEPEPLESVVERLSANLNVLREAFSHEREQFTRARIERAARNRGRAFVARLQGRG